MDFWKTLLILLKRWYVALPVFAVAIGGAGAVYAIMPMHYESMGVIVLTSPSSGATTTLNGQVGQTNPLLAFESSLAISASIVIQSINAPEIVKAMGADKPDHTFVLAGGAEGGPFISVKTESKSEQGARDLVVQVLDRVKAELRKRQEQLKAAPSTFIGVDDVVPPTKPEPLRGGKLRAAGVALVLGLVASLAAVFGFESFQNRKRRASADEDDDELDDFDDDDDDDEPVVARAVAEEPEVPAQPRSRPAPVPADLTQRVAPVRPNGHQPHQPATAKANGQAGPAVGGKSVPTKAPVGGKSIPGKAPVGGKSIPGNAKPANGKSGPNEQSGPAAGKAGPSAGNGQAPAGTSGGQSGNGQAAAQPASANGQAAPANGVATPGRVNGQPVGTGPTGNWPADEWREPPTLRMKPAQAPPDQRS